MINFDWLTSATDAPWHSHTSGWNSAVLRAGTLHVEGATSRDSCISPVVDETESGIMAYNTLNVRVYIIV